MPRPDSDVADLGLAEQGARRIAYAERAMPVLGALRERFGRERPLAGVAVSACMHVTPETAALVGTLVAAGASLSLAASNPLSTQDDVAAALVAGQGVSVFARQGADRQTYREHLLAVCERRPRYVLDDGCDLVALLHERPKLLSGVRGGCEETATGVLRLRQMAAAGALRLPMLAVNDTAVQLLVANRHGTGQSTWDAILRAGNVMLAGATVVVAGYGWVGSGVAARARGLGAQVVVTEVDPGRALEAVLDGHRVLRMTEAVPLGDVFVTCTGNRGVLGAAHFALMHDGAVLANAGHFDVEIDLPALSAQAASVTRVRPHVDEYADASGRRLLLLAEGRVVNLAAGEGHPPAVMDVSFAVQALALAFLAEEWQAGRRPEPGVHAVPAHIDREVARTRLAATGVQLDELTAAQQQYLSSWQG